MQFFEVPYGSKSDAGKAVVQWLKFSCSIYNYFFDEFEDDHLIINYLAETDTGSDLGSELESQLPDLETDSEYKVELEPDSESEQESVYWPDGQKKTKICEQSEPWSGLEFETESDEELNGMFS